MAVIFSRRRGRRRRLLRKPAQRPDDAGIDQQRQHEMGGKAVLRNFHPLAQSRCHHPPADRTLQRAETEDQPQPPPEVGAERAAPEKPEKRQQIGNADHAPEQAMAPFPPEDRLELAEIHAGIEFAILRNPLVALERLLPLLLLERRQRAGHRLPLDDRKPGFGETRRATDQHHQRDQCRHRQ